jgi:ABC-type branched-subunit amino acid transport system ATPase component
MPFVAFNCASVNPSLLESRFFGHEKGAFTDAKERSIGLFEQAKGGTLFLDEIGELDANAQSLLLRVLEGGRFTRLGGKEEILADVRLVTATNRDLPKMVHDGKFRLDLFKSVRNVSGLDGQIEHTLELVNLVERADTPVSDLAYGEKRRLEIGLALATSPSLLLLDEPLAGMSPRERVETVRLLKSIAQGRTMIVIDHDMDALFELAGRITVLQEGRVLVEGTPDEIKGNALVQDAYLGGVHEEELA